MNGIDEVSRAIQLRDQGHIEEAAGIIRSLRQASRHPRDIAYLEIMEASCFREMGDFLQASALLSLARTSTTNDESVILGLEHETARLERAQGLKAQALKRTLRILHQFRKSRQSPEYGALMSQLLAERAMLSAENGLYSEAIPLLKRCHAAEPQRSDVLYYLGDANFRTNRFEEAIENLSEVVQRYDLDQRLRTSAQYLLAYSYYKLGIYAQAISNLQKLESEGFGDVVSPASVFEMLADSFHRLRMDSEADQYRDKARRLS